MMKNSNFVVSFLSWRISFGRLVMKKRTNHRVGGSKDNTGQMGQKRTVTVIGNFSGLKVRILIYLQVFSLLHLCCCFISLSMLIFFLPKEMHAVVPQIVGWLDILRSLGLFCSSLLGLVGKLKPYWMGYCLSIFYNRNK